MSRQVRGGISKHRWIERLFQGSSQVRRRRRGAPTTNTESLEARIMPAVNAIFSPGQGILTVLGDGQDNTIEVSRDAAGKIRVNGGAVAIQGGTATVANTALIQVFGQNGNDTITLNEANGALPRANLFGGAGNDTLIGGSGADMLFGQAGNDTLLGKGGTDFLFGGSEHDVLTGGDGDDVLIGGPGFDILDGGTGDNILIEG